MVMTLASLLVQWVGGIYRGVIEMVVVMGEILGACHLLIWNGMAVGIAAVLTTLAVLRIWWTAMVMVG